MAQQGSEYSAVLQEVACQATNVMIPMLEKLQSLEQQWGELLNAGQGLEVPDGFKKAYSNYDYLDTHGETIDFNEESNRIFYCLRYGISHLMSLNQFLDMELEKKGNYYEWLKRNSANELLVCCLGGGPALEAFALDSHLHRFQAYEPSLQPKIGKATILDRCLEWHDMASILNEIIQIPHLSYEWFSVTDEEIQWSEDGEDALKKANIVTMIKFASAIRKWKMRSKEDLKEQYKEILQKMKKDSILVYMDTNCGEKYPRPLLEALDDLRSFTVIAIESYKMNVYGYTRTFTIMQPQITPKLQFMIFLKIN